MSSTWLCLRKLLRCSIPLLLLSGCGNKEQSMESSVMHAEQEVPSPADLPLRVLIAKSPILVAMGLPDDEHEASRILEARYQRRIAACMQAVGFDYVPAVDDESREHNRLVQNALPVEQRAAWYAAETGQALPGTPPATGVSTEGQDGCRGEAARSTLLLNHFPQGFPDAVVPTTLSDALDEARSAFEHCRAVSVDPAACDATAYEAATTTWARAWEIAVLELHYTEIAEFGRLSAEQ